MDLYDRINQLVSGAAGVAALALAVGCQAGDASTTVPADPPATLTERPRPSPPRDGPRDLGKYSITFYYMIGEDEVVAKKKRPANDNQQVVADVASATADAESELATIAPPEQVTVYSGTCEPLADVSRDFFRQLTLQGTGKLKDGRVLNVWGTCSCPESPCFKPVEERWGTAGTGRALQPFRTVAVDPKVIKLGSLLYVPLLEGRVMPGRAPWGGFVHDGCLIADDVGGAIKGKQLDLFVGRKGWFLGMSGKGSSHAWARQVPVFDGSKVCERKGRKVARKTGAI